jgi:hypothetical protein
MLGSGTGSGSGSGSPSGSGRGVSATSSQEHQRHEPRGQFSFVVTLAFTLNYIIGSGFLTLPYAFSQVGCILGVIGLSLLTIFAVSAASFVVESMARADYLKENMLEEEILNELKGEGRTQFRGNNYQSITTADSERMVTTFEVDGPDQRLLSVGKHHFEMTDLCKKFLGSTGLNVYVGFVTLYFYGTLWAYSTVFASSFHSAFGVSYEFFLVVFACVVVPCTMLDLTEQVTWQMAMAIWRIVMLALMISTVVIAHIYNADAFSGFQPDNTNGFFRQIDWSKLHILLPIVTYANIFHHSIPALSRPVADKSQTGNIFTAAICVCYVGYLLVGLMLGWYFYGSKLSASNLHWAAYVGCANPSAVESTVSSIISAFIVLFPACDVASAYPLNAITLGNSLMTYLYPGIEDKLDESDKSQQEFKNTKYAFRVVASAPPILGAYFTRDLGTVTNYSGLCGLAVAYVFPPLLCYYSEKIMKKHKFPSKTMYGGWYSTYPFQVAVCVFGVFAIAYVFVCNLVTKLH